MSKTKPYFKNPFYMIPALNNKNQHAKYCSNSFRNMQAFTKLALNKIIYLMCDFNINLLNIHEHITSSEFIEMLYTYAMYPLICKPTRVVKDTVTLIDNVYYNDIADNEMLNGILYTDISDHFPIFHMQVIIWSDLV